MNEVNKTSVFASGRSEVIAGNKVKINAGVDGDIPAGRSGTVLEVFDDPRAPLAYIGFADHSPCWVFCSDLETLPQPLPPSPRLA